MQRLMAGGRSEATLPRTSPHNTDHFIPAKHWAEATVPRFPSQGSMDTENIPVAPEVQSLLTPQTVTEEESETNFSSDNLKQISHEVHS